MNIERITAENVAQAWPCTERVNKAVIAERERIIALLESDNVNVNDDGSCYLENHPPEACHCLVIALINGEN